MKSNSFVKSFVSMILSLVGVVFVARAEAPAGYATENLVAVWDCSSGLDANGWKSCFAEDGKDHVFEWQGTDKDTLVFDATNGVCFTGKAVYGMLSPTDCEETFKKAQNGTMEIVVVREATSSSTWGCALQVATAYGNQALFFYDGKFSGSGDGSSNYPLCKMVENSALLRSISIGYTGGKVDIDHVLMNNERVETSGVAGFTNGDAGGAILGWRQNKASNFRFIGRILAIRLYSEKLSEEHAFVNACTDMRRFGYVKKGLLAVWDCASGLNENGWTSSFTTNGASYTFTWAGNNKSTITYDATNGVQFTGVTGAYGLLSPGDCNETFKLTRGGTMEIVVRKKAPGNACALQVTPANGNQALMFYEKNGMKFSCNAENVSHSLYPMKEDSRLLRSFAATYTDAGSQNLVYQNGERINGSGTEKFDTGDNGAVLGCRQAKHWPFTGSIFAIRLYARQLQADEIAANVAADQLLFDRCVKIVSSDETRGTVSQAEGTIGVPLTVTANPVFGCRFAGWRGTDDSVISYEKTLTTTPYKREIMAKFLPSSEFDYETTDRELVAMWDCASGLDATGWTTAYAKDGGSYKYVWTGSETDLITYTPTTGVRFVGNENAYGQLSEEDAQKTFLLATNGAMEVVFVNEDVGLNAIALITADNCGGQALGFWNSKYIFGTLRKLAWGSYTPVLNRLCTASFGYSEKTEVTANRRVDGISIPNTATSDSLSHNGVGSMIGRRQNGFTNNPFKGRILAIRLYSGKLSDEKAKMNYEFDQSRFTTSCQTIRTRVAAGSEEMGTVTAGGDYVLGTSVTLTATPASDKWVFSHWEGDIDGLDEKASELTFSVDKCRDLEAVFAKQVRGLILIVR